jgi:hypothetical protein
VLLWLSLFNLSILFGWVILVLLLLISIIIILSFSFFSFFLSYRIYLSSGNSQFEGSSHGSELSVLSPPAKESVTNSNTCLVEAISNPSVPKHAIHAFQLLSSSAEAQVIYLFSCLDDG